MKLVKNANPITEDTNTMFQGKVKWYNETKGFGFIEVEGKKDVFVHRSGIETPYGNLTEGQEVEFDIKQGDKGDIAVNVK